MNKFQKPWRKFCGPIERILVEVSIQLIEKEFDIYLKQKQRSKIIPQYPHQR